jgi:hypothetical protein
MNLRLMGLSVSLGAVACSAPDSGDLFPAVDASVKNDSETISAFLEVVDSAKRSLQVALPSGSSTDLADGIIAARDRGVDVEVITDVDIEQSTTISALIDAEIPLRLADGPVAYFDFSTNTDVSWSSDQTVMSHAFAVADGLRFVNASDVGSSGGVRVVFEGRGEELCEDMLKEHRQIFAGIDSTALTGFSAMAKSIADHRWRYGTSQDADLEVWFGPQERLGKRITDAVYSARHSVRILTNEFANEGLAIALQEKAADGFDVQVIVGPNFGQASSILSRVLQNEADDVDKLQITVDGHVPTVVLIDADRAYSDSSSRGMVASHAIYPSTKLYRGSALINDQYVDGNLWVINDWDERSELLETLVEAYQYHLDNAEAL